MGDIGIAAKMKGAWRSSVIFAHRFSSWDVGLKNCPSNLIWQHVVPQ
jgi:hypothetical protein